jgi:hypothetical protein
MGHLSLSSLLAILRLDGYDRGFVSKWIVLTGILTLLGALTLWRLVVMIIRWWNRPCKSPQRLFRALCDRHQLNQSERSILQNMAKAGAYDPNFLFIDPDLWTAKNVESESEPQRQALFQKLFGEISVAG